MICNNINEIEMLFVNVHLANCYDSGKRFMCADKNTNQKSVFMPTKEASQGVKTM